MTNILVDEGYSYSFLAVAVALLFFGSQCERLVWIAPVSVCGRSGWLVPVEERDAAGGRSADGGLSADRAATRACGWLVVVLVAAAPFGWALHQHHASGRYSVGTSLDGINLHKGNNAGFLEHYPSPHGDSMDWYDFELNRGLYFGDEWSFNDYHERAALDYLRSHPRETLEGEMRKVNVLFFCRREDRVDGELTALRKLVEDAGMVVFRLMLWAAILSAIYLAVARSRT